jgi:hypothetical protein
VIDALGFIGSTGLCPGNILRNGNIPRNGSTMLAYRFTTLKDGDAKHLIEQLNEIVDDWKRAQYP